MNSRAYLDLKSLPGAEILQVNLQKCGSRACVCIPVEFSDIHVTNWEKPDEAKAYVNLSVRELNEKYFEKAKQNNANDPNYILPTHSISLAMRKQTEEKFEPSVKAKVLRNNPDMGEADVTREVYNMLRPKLGMMTPFPEKQINAPVAVATAPIMPPVPAADGEVQANGDMPF